MYGHRLSRDEWHLALAMDERDDEGDALLRDAEQERREDMRREGDL